MKKSDHLHALVHSLTKAEKRQFKINAAHHTKEGCNNYIALFDAIEKQKEYDEVRLKRKLKAYSFVNNIAKTRHLLYCLILKTLRYLDETKSYQNKLSVLQRDARVFVSKAMYKEAYQKLQKAECIAREWNLNKILLSILDEQAIVLPYTHQLNINKKLVALAKERLKLVDRLGREEKLRSLLASMSMIYSTTDFEKKVSKKNLIEKLWKNHSFPESQVEDTFHAKIYYFEIQALLQQSRFNFQEAAQSLFKAKGLWENKKELIHLFSEDYIRITANYVLCRINAKSKFESLDATLDEVRWMNPVSRQIATRNFFLGAVLDFIYSLTNLNLENCKIQLFTLKELINEHIDKLTIEWRLMLYYHIVIYHFLNRDFDEVLTWIKFIRSYEENGIYPAIQSYCNLIGLLARYEMSQTADSKSILILDHEMLSGVKDKKELEQAALVCVKGLLNARGEWDIQKAVFCLKNTIHRIESSNTHIQIMASKMLNLWISHKLKGEDMVIFN